MFAARNADVSFSNIKLIVDGNEVYNTVQESSGDDTPAEEQDQNIFMVNWK